MDIEGINAYLDTVNRANLVLLSNRPPHPVDALFLHMRSFGDYTGLYELAEEMARTQVVKFIAVSNNEGEKFGSTVPFEANPGKTECIRILTEEQKIPPDKILTPETMAHHTRQENDAFLKLSMQREFTSGVILAQPHQLLRAMLGMIQVMDMNKYLMKIYTAAPGYTDWQEKVRGSQGKEFKPRVEHIPDEVKRVYEYQIAGQLASFERLFDYLNARGSERFKLL